MIVIMIGDDGDDDDWTLLKYETNAPNIIGKMLAPLGGTLAVSAPQGAL